MTRRYPAYRDSGVRWLGQIPERWETRRFKSVLREREERSTDGAEVLLSVSAYTGVTPRSENIDDGDFISRAESLEGYKVCYPTDLVMNIMLAWNRAQGVSAYGGIVSPAYAVFELAPSIHPPYLNYLVRSNEYCLYFKAHSAGVIDSRLRLYPEQFGALHCIFPPLAEQTAIAAFLDRETAKIDALVAEQRRLIDLLKEKRQAVISHAVTRGLNPAAKLKTSGVDWLGDVPEAWEVVPLKRITLERCDGPFGSGLKSEHYVDSGTLVVRLQNIKAEGFFDSEPAFIDSDYALNELGRHEVLAGDLLIAGLGDERNLVGRACVAPSGIEPAMVKADCFRFRLDPERAQNDFIAFQLNASAAHDAGTKATGTTRARIPLSQMAERTVALPSLAEQEEIVAYLSRVSTAFNELSAAAEAAITLLQERRSALISAAVTGKIDVRDLVAETEAA